MSVYMYPIEEYYIPMIIEKNDTELKAMVFPYESTLQNNNLTRKCYKYKEDSFNGSRVALLTVPKLKKVLFYVKEGEMITPEWDIINDNKYIYGGDILVITNKDSEGTEYYSTVEPNTGYCWANGSTDIIEYTWSYIIRQ